MNISTPIDDDDHLPPAFSEEAMAFKFAANNSSILRFVGAWGKWMSWTGSVWKQDETYMGFHHARKIARFFAFQANDPKSAKAIASAKTAAAIERLAKSERGIAATVDQWDADDWLLNTPGGVVDLKTGEMREHRPEDYMTKITAVSPGGECPLWLAFLEKIMGGDTELISYLQRVLGYALTGSTKEHALFFFHGGGGNGKGTFVETAANIMADYHVKSSIDTFTETRNVQHSTNIAGLAGARFITVSETQGGRRWNEGLVKELTGGDALRARKMRQDEFTFQPKGKLTISGQHKPGLRSVDEAMRRRFNLVEFAVTISKKEKDVDLPEKLKAEWPGILKWMIEGCLEWQRIGLSPPEAVLASTDKYLEAEDTMASWIDECCIVEKTAVVASGAMWASWRQWTEHNKEFTGSQTAFSLAVGKRGFELRNRRFTGIRLRSESEPPM
ncbi:MAG: hypothetical protein E5Y65_26050 [Mesorhizobium sp.]|uniref:phage/plasmid primase, P4 family n=1 Tax=Mesorhizobium sp. TaxID=1871066 RepID=UPI001222268D|nr:phage/plasmid primase, P4 family [Mesorhizobium sp.]TIL72278.1 MAG: hypothetical protein E5Y70_22450 [Mesorhizobium sp.]TIL86612.1 MAG: hypothetical protein E5Y65_26050 [Mesorhizobium sp.]TIL98387.1 MAG: hypothetical protein E5Y64_26470 [Mesorhizobium sp.]TIN21202.1 MAG: hypothetical protein E5Y59_02545 [Mesorhizobium sp.]